MLFDGGMKEARMEELEGMLDKAFDDKLSSINSKASGLILGIEQAKQVFLEACDRFENSSATPDRESIRAGSESYVVEQKSVYIGALRRIIKAESSLSNKNLYTSYHSKLASGRGLMDEILKINNKFRIVLEAYANELGRFKNAYTLMDRALKELQMRLDSKATEFKEYNDLLQEIEKLEAFSRELEELEAVSREFEGGAAADIDKEANAAAGQFRGELAAKTLEIGSIDRAIADARSTILAHLAPLDKPARKYEHGTTSKMHLTYYLEDPVGTLSNREAGLREFSQHVVSLKKEIDESRIEVKNRREVAQAMDFVLNENIVQFLNEIEILKGKRKGIEQEIRELERSIREIDRTEGEKRRKVMAAGEIKENMQRVKAARNTAIKNIEGMFERFYRKKLKVTL